MKLNTKNQQAMYDNLKFLTDNWEYRSHRDQSLVVNFLKEEFTKAGAVVSTQKFSVEPNGGTNTVFENIIASYGPIDAPRIIVGAHYDVCDVIGISPGADDNGTGVVGLIALANRIYEWLQVHGSIPLTCRVDIVAYANEEPPFFGTNDMGSVRHAKYLKDNNIPVITQICLEMIGYFSDAPNSQEFPPYLGQLGLSLPTVGNFIAICGRATDRQIVADLTRCANSVKEDFALPLALPRGVFHELELSDHASYWDEGIPAVMITDTAYLRNTNYHTEFDTIDTINFTYMERVIDSLEAYLLQCHSIKGDGSYESS